MFKTLTAASTLVFLLASAAPARADWLLTPYLGLTFGGDTPDNKPTYGASLAFLGGGVFGFEFDAALTPDFLDVEDGDLEDSNVSTVMGNLMLSVPMSNPGIRPYVSGGAGLIRIKATSVGNVFDVDDSSFGVNVGGGIVGQFNERVGLRGDVRYFRSIQDSEEGDGVDLDLGGFNFWRGSVGLTFRF